MILTGIKGLEAVFGWLLEASWQASVLALLVLALQGALRGRLNPRWNYALWLLVLLRLLMPALPQSAWSLFQFTPETPQVIAVSVSEPLFTSIPSLPSPPSTVVSPAPAEPLTLYSLLTVVWLVGAMTLLVLTWQVNRRFARQVDASPEIDDPDLLRLFATAKNDLGLHRSIRLIENAQVQSPAIMGLFRPTLLLPARVRDKFDAVELRLIFLHELAHLKRGDVIAQGLIALLQILHWFNPVLWFAFHRMRADREPATDALVLSRTGEAEKERYGLMLIKLLEHFNQRHSLPTLVGILEDKDQFKRRFSLIARFTKGAYGWSLLGVFVVGVLALTCLTRSKAEASGIAATSSQMLTISGMVIDLDGHPVPNAKVVVYNSTWRKNITPSYSPSSPAPSLDFKKVGISDAQGHFSLKNVSHDFLFTLVADAPGYGPDFVENVDPKSGPITIKLTALKPGEAGGTARGHVVDPEGKPIVGAKVEAYCYTHGDSTLYASVPGENHGNQDRIVDYITETDSDGNFSRPFEKGYQGVGVEISATGFAHKKFQLLPYNNQIRELALNHGASVTGRLVKEGRPVPNVQVGISQVSHLSATMVDEVVATTDSEGRFVLRNVVSNDECEIHGKRDSLGLLGVTKPYALKVGGEGTSTDAGDIQVLPGRKVTGEIILSDGKPWPHDMIQLHISRDDGSDDLQYHNLVSSPHFEFLALDGDHLALHAWIHGYILRPQHPNSWGTETVIVGPDLQPIQLRFEPEPTRAAAAPTADLPNVALSASAFPPTPSRPLQIAIEKGQYNEVKTLLDHGAVIYAPDYWSALGLNSRSPIMKLLWEHGPRYCSELAYAVSQDRPANELKKLLDHGIPSDPPEDQMITPLGIAAQRGNLEAVQLLIKRGANLHPINDILNPLNDAVQAKNPVDMVDYLLKSGVQANYLTILNAICWRSAKSAELEIQAGGLKNISEDNVNSLLICACETENSEVLTLLLNAGLHPESKRTEGPYKGQSVLEITRAAYAHPDGMPWKMHLKPMLDMLEAASTETSTQATPEPTTRASEPNKPVLTGYVKPDSIPGTKWLSAPTSQTDATAPSLNFAPNVSDIAITGKLRLDKPELVDLKKSVGTLVSVGDAAKRYEFHFQPDGSFSIPHVQPGVYNRSLALWRKEQDTSLITASAITVIESPVTADTGTPKMTMNLDVAVPFKDGPKGSIQVGMILVEIQDDVYHAHQAEIDAVVEKGGAACLNLLNNLKGVSILTAPSVTTQPDLKANIEIVREFPYPTSFKKSKTGTTTLSDGTTAPLKIPPSPREFVTKDVGVSAELTPSLDSGKIILNGKLSVIEFEGFTKSNLDVQMPSFSTSETSFFEALDDHQNKGIWIPGTFYKEQKKIANPIDPAQAFVRAVPPTETIRTRRLVFLSATVVK